MALKALFRPVARAPIPAVAAKATSAKIRRYSTKPWPASSRCNWAREFRTKVLSGDRSRCRTYMSMQMAKVFAWTYPPSEHYILKMKDLSPLESGQRQIRVHGLQRKGTCFHLDKPWQMMRQIGCTRWVRL